MGTGRVEIFLYAEARTGRRKRVSRYLQVEVLVEVLQLVTDPLRDLRGSPSGSVGEVGLPKMQEDEMEVRAHLIPRRCRSHFLVK